MWSQMLRVSRMPPVLSELLTGIKCKPRSYGLQPRFTPLIVNFHPTRMLSSGGEGQKQSPLVDILTSRVRTEEVSWSYHLNLLELSLVLRPQILMKGPISLAEYMRYVRKTMRGCN